MSVDSLRCERLADRLLRVASDSCWQLNGGGATWPTGMLGWALFLDAVDRVCPSQTIQRQLKATIESAFRPTPSGGCGLFDGPVAAAAAISVVSRGGQRYARLLSTLDEQACSHARAVMSSYSEGKLRTAAIDCAGGAAGLLTYGRVRNALFETNSRWAAVLEDARDILRSALCRAEPCKFTPAEVADDPFISDRVWGIDLGVAHGLAGAGAAAARVGLVSEARRAFEFLSNHLVEDAYGPYLPYSTANVDNYRSGWCYGVPGVLGVASEQLRDTTAWAAWVRGATAVPRRPLITQRLEGELSLCHGLAGAAHCLIVAGRAENATEIMRAGEQLAVETMEACEKLFAAVSRSSSNPSFLLGLAGTGAALLAFAQDSGPEWNRLLMLPETR